MVSKKKTPAQRARWPKGHPLAGKFADKQLFAEYQQNVKIQRRAERKRAAMDRKNTRLREKRTATRAARSTLMARADGMTGRTDLQRQMGGWGSTSTSRLRAGRTYAWHGAIRISGGMEALGKILSCAGSSRKKPKQKGDGSYEVIVTPWLGNFTPGEAENMVPDIARSVMDEYQDKGVTAVYLGAFYSAGETE